MIKLASCAVPNAGWDADLSLTATGADRMR
jgi:hypothetical protein